MNNIRKVDNNYEINSSTIKSKKTLPLIVIVGPTASGKTSLAIELAEKYNGEIICADSRSIYIGADIGTAKATDNDQKRIVHHGLDLVHPNEHFTAADFKKYANKKIADIRSRGKIPFLVGGTGLYIDSVIFDFEFAPAVNPEFRQKLEAFSIEELYEYCNENNINLPENYKNKRYVIRNIERNGAKMCKKSSPIDNVIIIGISYEKEILRKRIEQRSDCFFNSGVIEEARKLGETYGWDNEAMKCNIYRLIKLYFDGQINYSELKQKNIVADWRLAKKQLTWFKRNKFIKWLSLKDVEDYVSLQLANYS